MQNIGITKARSAFTLVEIMIVIGIIGVLAALLLPAVLSGGKKKYVAETAALIQNLKIALDDYASDTRFGDYPPTSLRLLDDTFSTNGVNEGIESAAACLSTQDRGFSYDPGKEDYYGNTDGDNLPNGFSNNSRFKKRGALELLDAFGNPLVYIRGSDIKNIKSYMQKIKRADGKIITVKLPKPDKNTGNIPDESRFLIWSLGPDGEDNQGEGDDICSWK
jgi:prepilin-type N-terminal cleavage/methylation domain-containing protein